MVHGKLGPEGWEVCQRMSTPPDEVGAFVGFSGFGAWPFLVEVEKAVVQSGVVGVTPGAGIYE